MSVQILLAFALCLGLPGIFIIQFWFMAFCMNAVLDGAAGEEDLNQPSITSFVEDVIVPGFKFILTLLIVRLPVVIYLIVTMWPGGIGSGEVMAIMGALFTGPFEAIGEEAWSGELSVLGGLYLAGAFFWPMVLLVVAIGNVPALVRIDLILKTIVKSFPAYLCTVVLVYISLLLPVVYMAAGLALTEPSLSGTLVLLFLAQGVEVYATIMAMRVTGLYYHHFKHRFAWSWG